MHLLRPQSMGEAGGSLITVNDTGPGGVRPNDEKLIVQYMHCSLVSGGSRL